MGRDVVLVSFSRRRGRYRLRPAFATLLAAAIIKTTAAAIATHSQVFVFDALADFFELRAVVLFFDFAIMLHLVDHYNFKGQGAVGATPIGLDAVFPERLPGN